MKLLFFRLCRLFYNFVLSSQNVLLSNRALAADAQHCFLGCKTVYYLTIEIGYSQCQMRTKASF